MAKSKAQKQREAIWRKRKNFTHYLRTWYDTHPGGKTYAFNVGEYGVEAANEVARKADKDLERAAREAHLDRHGNPLEIGLDVNGPSTRLHMTTDTSAVFLGTVLAKMLGRVKASPTTDILQDIAELLLSSQYVNAMLMISKHWKEIQNYGDISAWMEGERLTRFVAGEESEWKNNWIKEGAGNGST